jgi:hypothetical protein
MSFLLQLITQQYLVSSASHYAPFTSVLILSCSEVLNILSITQFSITLSLCISLNTGAHMILQKHNHPVYFNQTVSSAAAAAAAAGYKP